MSNERFMRTSILLGENAMTRIYSSKVMIIGLGAVGGYALEAIARAGTGHIVLVDFDKFEPTNINRQLLATDNSIGRFKTEVAAERIRQINPNCEIETFNVFVDEKTIPDLLMTKPDFVIDAIDSLSAKSTLMKTLWLQKIPFISSMGAALKTDPAKVKTTTLDRTQNCGLAKQLRHRLRNMKVNISEINCVYSDEAVDFSSSAKKETENNKYIMGSLPTITAIFGLTLANHVILKIAQKKIM